MDATEYVQREVRALCGGKEELLYHEAEGYCTPRHSLNKRLSISAVAPVNWHSILNSQSHTDCIALTEHNTLHNRPYLHIIGITYKILSLPYITQGFHSTTGGLPYI